jgi:hypothetical protein
MASSSSSPGLEEDRLLVALNAARDDVAAAYRAGGSVQLSHGASVVDRMHSVVGYNDAFALEGHRRQAKKTKKYVEGRELMSNKAMCKADRESDIGRALERADARVEIAELSASAAFDAAAVAAADAASAHGSARPVPPQLFGTGQSVLQWWAGWFVKCREGETPKQIGKKLRPAWFSAEILSYVGYKDIVYAGVRTTGHCYTVA